MLIFKEKKRVKSRTMVIETVLTRESLYYPLENIECSVHSSENLCLSLVKLTRKKLARRLSESFHFFSKDVHTGSILEHTKWQR